MTTKVDIAGTYTFHGQRLTNPDQPFYLRFESGGRLIPGLSYTSPTGFFRYTCTALTYVHAYRLDGQLIHSNSTFLFPYTDRSTCRVYWDTPNGSTQYELKATNDDTGRLVITIQPWPNPTEPTPNPLHPTTSLGSHVPPYPPKPVEGSLMHPVKPNN